MNKDYTTKLRRRGAWCRAARCRSSRTCRSTDGPCGRPSRDRLSVQHTTQLESVTHEDTGTALGGGALTTETLDLAVGLHLVVLQDGHLDLLALVLDLLGGLLRERNLYVKGCC